MGRDRVVGAQIIEGVHVYREFVWSSDLIDVLYEVYAEMPAQQVIEQELLPLSAA